MHEEADPFLSQTPRKKAAMDRKKLGPPNCSGKKPPKYPRKPIPILPRPAGSAVRSAPRRPKRILPAPPPPPPPMIPAPSYVLAVLKVDSGLGPPFGHDPLLTTTDPSAPVSVPTLGSSSPPSRHPVLAGVGNTATPSSSSPVFIPCAPPSSTGAVTPPSIVSSWRSTSLSSALPTFGYSHAEVAVSTASGKNPSHQPAVSDGTNYADAALLSSLSGPSRVPSPAPTGAVTPPNIEPNVPSHPLPSSQPTPSYVLSGVRGARTPNWHPSHQPAVADENANAAAAILSSLVGSSSSAAPATTEAVTEPNIYSNEQSPSLGSPSLPLNSYRARARVATTSEKHRPRQTPGSYRKPHEYLPMLGLNNGLRGNFAFHCNSCGHPRYDLKNHNCIAKAQPSSAPTTRELSSGCWGHSLEHAQKPHPVPATHAEAVYPPILPRLPSAQNSRLDEATYAGAVYPPILPRLPNSAPRPAPPRLPSAQNARLGDATYAETMYPPIRPSLPSAAPTPAPPRLPSAAPPTRSLTSGYPASGAELGQKPRLALASHAGTVNPSAPPSLPVAAPPTRLSTSGLPRSGLKLGQTPRRKLTNRVGTANPPAPPRLSSMKPSTRSAKNALKVGQKRRHVLEKHGGTASPRQPPGSHRKSHEYLPMLGLNSGLRGNFAFHCNICGHPRYDLKNHVCIAKAQPSAAPTLPSTSALPGNGLKLGQKPRRRFTNRVGTAHLPLPPRLPSLNLSTRPAKYGSLRNALKIGQKRRHALANQRGTVNPPAPLRLPTATPSKRPTISGVSGLPSKLCKKPRIDLSNNVGLVPSTVPRFPTAMVPSHPLSIGYPGGGFKLGQKPRSVVANHAGLVNLPLPPRPPIFPLSLRPFNCGFPGCGMKFDRFYDFNRHSARAHGAASKHGRGY